MKPLLKSLIVALLLAVGMVSAHGGKVIYFLVGIWPGGFHDSYVVPLSKPEDIEHARDLIVRGPTVLVLKGGQWVHEPNQPLVRADVRAGRDGINRNYKDPRLREWSWHVSGSSFNSGIGH